MIRVHGVHGVHGFVFLAQSLVAVTSGLERLAGVQDARDRTRRWATAPGSASLAAV